MKRLSGILLCIVAGGIAAYYARPYAEDNSDVVLIIVTVFSVFAGFLIAIITIIGDPIMIREGSWRIAEFGRDPMRGRLFFHVLLFGLYLVTIAAIFVGALLEKTLVSTHSSIKEVIEWLYLFLGITSFLFTFALPLSLWSMQRARYDAEVERRRARDGIAPDPRHTN